MAFNKVVSALLSTGKVNHLSVLLYSSSSSILLLHCSFHNNQLCGVFYSKDSIKAKHFIES